MDEYKHCMNVLLTRAGLISMVLQTGDKDATDKIYNEALEWFKETYELKKK